MIATLTSALVSVLIATDFSASGRLSVVLLLDGEELPLRLIVGNEVIGEPYTTVVDGEYVSHPEVLGNPFAIIWNGDQQLEFSSVEFGGSDAAPRTGGSVRIEFEPFDSVLELSWVRTISGCLGTGTWTKQRPGGPAVVQAMIYPEATRLPMGVVRNGSPPKPGPFDGRWRVDFEHSDEDGIAVFRSTNSEGGIEGTFRTTTGDYRFLQGKVEHEMMTLSTFDGAHAFAFRADIRGDGLMRGEFWSGNWWHERWTAVRDDDYQLPDPFGLTTITDDNFAALSFPDLEGEDRTIGEFLEKGPTIIEVFGSWCPNCTDASDLLAEYVQTYEDLNVLGLAVEFGEDHETNASRVRKHLSHHAVNWPVLIASTTIDKAEATTELGFLDKVRSYPTLIFVDEGEAGPEVRAVYTGFNGPATGDTHLKMREDFERIIANMLRD